MQAQAPYRSTIAAPLDCGCHLGIFVAGLWIKNPRESPQSWGRHVPANRVPRTEYLPRDPRTMDVTRQGAKRQSPREGNGITHGLGGVPGPIVRARPTDYGGNSLNLFLFLFPRGGYKGSTSPPTKCEWGTPFKVWTKEFASPGQCGHKSLLVRDAKSITPFYSL